MPALVTTGGERAAADLRRRARIDYEPNDRQRVAHATFADERFYGGAAGGGKSRFIRAELLALCLTYPGFPGLILRQSFPDLNRSGGMIPALRQEVPRELGTYNATDHVWTFRNGSTLELGHLGRDADVTKYQGAEYGAIAFDELTQFTEFRFRYLLSRLRVAGELRELLERDGLRPHAIGGANPGGVGHGWVKSRFIDPAPPGVVWRPRATLDDPKPGTRVFIPARVTDNPHIDSSYINRLNALDDDQRRALRDGDWDVYQGQRFRSWRRAIHVIDPEELPVPIGAGLIRGIGVDYGLDAPFAALWGAKMGDGLVVVYRELYKAGLTPTQQAERILDAEAPGERDPRSGRRVPVALDPSTWARNPHHAAAIKPVDADEPPEGSIAAAYRAVLGRDVHKARNDRLAGVGLVADKLRVRADGLPRLLVYSTCRNLIRTLPTLPRSEKRPEDVDTTAEDHAYDGLRYLLMDLETAGVPAGAPPDRRSRGGRELEADAVDTMPSESGLRLDSDAW